MMFDCGGIYQDKPYYIQYFGTERRKWTPDILLDIQARVQQRKRERDEAKAAATAVHQTTLATSTVALPVNVSGAAASEATATTTTTPSGGTYNRIKPTVALQPNENTYKHKLRATTQKILLPTPHSVSHRPRSASDRNLRREETTSTRGHPKNRQHTDQHGAQSMEQRTPGGGGSRPRWLSQFL